MLVYRIEHHENKIGPYIHLTTTVFSPNHEHRDRHLDQDHPGFRHDFDIPLNDYIFGFPSKEALNTWFLPCEIRNLFKLGFKVSRYETNNYFIGKSEKQLIFKPE